MSECSCEAVLLGREWVKGTANADSLAGQIRRVVAAAGRRCRLRCSRSSIEIRPLKRQEDEGFESDDDAVSQTSSDSSSSCCFVEDHVLKPTGAEPAATDSANSSGASDNDDADPPKQRSPDREVYALGDVAFCHTDAGYPKVLVLVIKKKNKEDVQSPSGLEAVIFQCKSVQNVREVCASYKEFSRRLKMDLQFRYPHKRKDTSSGSSYRSVFEDLQKSVATSPANSSFFKTPAHHVADANKKYNLVQRTDEDGVTHIEVSEAGVSGDFYRSAEELSGSSSIISISTPGEGNLFASLGSGEIDAVICADIESSPESDSKNTASDRSAETNEDKNTTETEQETPPKRPQRGKYIKNSKTKQIKNDEKLKTPENDTTKTPVENVKQTSQEKVVRGQYIRVNVEQQRQSSTPRPTHRLFSETRPSGQMLSYPAWSLPSPVERGRRPREDHRRSRSSGPPRRASPPPARPLVYRYIDNLHPRPLSNKVFGKLKEIASINNACVGTLSRRRNSSGDLSTVQFYTHLEPSLKVNVSKSTTNLKSVIKKRSNENVEPKKVTFSAYATVQVVD